MKEAYHRSVHRVKKFTQEALPSKLEDDKMSDTYLDCGSHFEF